MLIKYYHILTTIWQCLCK